MMVKHEMTATALALLLKKLSFEVDVIISELDPQAIAGAINWGDLGCAEAWYAINDQGEEWFRVRIEEADPVNPALINAVGRGLSARGWPDNVEVRCEW